MCGGTPARLFRISFSGELAYEIAVPSRYGEALLAALLAAGEEFGAVAYGTEALGVMRIEKGHAAGNELNGQTTARMLGLQRMVSKKKDCIGNVLSERPEMNRADGLEMMGFRPVEAGAELSAGAHFLAVGAEATMEADEGWISSVAWSPTLHASIGLGFIRQGRARIGETVRAWDAVRGTDIRVEIVSPHFHDPAGERLRGLNRRSGPARRSTVMPAPSARLRSPRSPASRWFRRRFRSAATRRSPGRSPEGFGAERPATGASAAGDRFGLRVLGLQPDQLFLLFEPPDPDRAAETVAAALGPAAYIADQSDSWAMLRMSGAGVRTALERICPLDLEDRAFPEGRVARTAMEHLSVIVLRDGADGFLLMSPRSSARSFLHAAVLSAEHVAG